MNKFITIVILFLFFQSCAPYICERQYGVKSYIEVDERKIIDIDTIKNEYGGAVKIVKYRSWKKE